MAPTPCAMVKPRTESRLRANFSVGPVHRNGPCCSRREPIVAALPRPPDPSERTSVPIETLSMAIVVDQKRLGGGSHSTVGTITDISAVLRLLYSRIGQPHVGNYNVFSFNDPQGMCPECNGLGRKFGVNLDVFLDTSKS